MEFTLLFAALIGVLGIYGMLWWEGRRGNAANCSRNLWDVALAAVIVGAFVGRLAAMISDGVNPLTNPGDILIVRAGIATGWASLAAMGTVAWQARDDGWALSDGLAAAALAGLAGWHAGCLVREACLGTPSDLPWAIAQPGSAVTRHPVELYAAALFALAAVGVALWKTRVAPVAAPTGAALVAAGLIRLLTEPLRPSLGGGPVAWYVAAMVVGGVMIVAATRRRATANT